MNQSTQMSYHEFFSVLSCAILQELGTDYETYPVTNAKNNGIHRQGIVIRQKERKAAPAIYLDSYYQEYQSGKILSDILRHILYVYRESTTDSGKYSLEKIELTAEYMQSHLICTLVGYQKNEALLQGLPHIRLFDLAIYFKLLVYQNEEGIGTIRFTNQHFEQLLPMFATHDASKQLHMLYQLAIANTQRLFPFRFHTLRNMMEHLVGGAEPTRISLTSCADAKDSTLYVLTNAYGIGGAACILYPGVLQYLQNYLTSDFFLIPSSIHELLIMPKHSNFSQEQLNDMISEINQTQVPAEDVLSNRSYRSEEWEEVLSLLSERADGLSYTMNE